MVGDVLAGPCSLSRALLRCWHDQNDGMWGPGNKGSLLRAGKSLLCAPRPRTCTPQIHVQVTGSPHPSLSPHMDMDTALFRGRLG